MKINVLSQPAISSQPRLLTPFLGKRIFLQSHRLVQDHILKENDNIANSMKIEDSKHCENPLDITSVFCK